MRIRRNGNIGIGVANENDINRLLTVNGTGRFQNILYFGGTEANLPHIYALIVGAGRNLILNSGGSGSDVNQVALSAGTGDVGGFWPTINNNVNLGSTSLRWRTIWSNNPLNSSSDQRLKTAVTPLASSLDKVMRMRPVSYRWIDDDGHTHLGFIAQEMENIVPEVVRTPRTTHDQEGNVQESHYAMVYAELIPVLTQAIQEQQKMIEELKEEIRLLKEGK
jgi:hypothetical protein